MSTQVKKFNDTLLSVLELAQVNEGSDAKESFRCSVDLAQHLEKYGFNRIWFAEHHNMPGVASSATSLLIGHILAHTERIRVGSGGVMLPNHAPLVVAEQFGTLESLFPGRVDLGIGRAPGTDQATAYALRRTLHSSAEDFPKDLQELMSYFKEDRMAHVKAYPGEGLSVPIWLLGSSDFSARLSGQLGLPFSFASHFAPAFLIDALKIYYHNFKPSQQLAEPYTMIGINVIAADTDEEAEYLATSLQQQFLNLARGISMKFQPPTRKAWDDYERQIFEKSLDPNTTIIGSAETVERKLKLIIERTRTKELIISSPIFNHEARLRSFEILSEMME